jgi:hypothetical protein
MSIMETKPSLQPQDAANNNELPFYADIKKYEILGHSLQEGNWKPQRTLENYVTATDGVIGVLDGSIPNTRRGNDLVYLAKKRGEKFDVFGEQITTKLDLPNPDIVVWLDKSARPVSWLTHKLWQQLATPNESGEIPNRPKSMFLNIDRQPWVSKVGVDWRKNDAKYKVNFDVNDLSHDEQKAKDELARIRLLFVQDSRIEKGKKITLSEENWREEAWKMPLKHSCNNQKPRHVIVIDEVKYSGDTLDIAQRLLAAALPGIPVSGMHWYKPIKEEWNPAWYSKQDEKGRGVGNIGNGWYQGKGRERTNFKHRLAASVLSPPLVDRDTGERISDQKSIQLRKDIATLAIDLSSNNILYKPSFLRRFTDTKRVTDMNGGISLSVFRDASNDIIRRRY